MTTTRSPLEARILFYFASNLTTAQEGGFLLYYFEEDISENYHLLSDDIYPLMLNPVIQNLSIMEKQRCHLLATSKPNAEKRKPIDLLSAAICTPLCLGGKLDNENITLPLRIRWCFHRLKI